MMYIKFRRGFRVAGNFLTIEEKFNLRDMGNVFQFAKALKFHGFLAFFPVVFTLKMKLAELPL